MADRLGRQSAGALLQAAYRSLGYVEGALLDATDSAGGMGADEWINKGEWLSLAKRVNAEKVFFVQHNPVIVFAQCGSNEEQRRFQEIWNMARPPLLFLESPGELAVYDLTQGPAENTDDWKKTLSRRRLNRARTIAEVAEKLKAYRREQVESGRLFEEVRFGEDQRADKALIADLQVVRRRLAEHRNLKHKYAHALIGRSIFIRYLEDRQVLVREYFRRVGAGDKDWQKILDTPLSGVFADPTMRGRLYLRVLQNKEFTYALFDQLGKDFNGDMFPEDKGEEEAVTQTHLDLLRGFLCGSSDREHPRLFFFAYKFDIIPIELISSIYEEFYAAESEDKASHYTPPALVEFILSDVLTHDRLSKAPRILDPACGSGIFLVESFRRIVRYRAQCQERRLTREELLEILRDQIAGIDINEEAIRVAAFSLYLAFLHYQEPPDILAQIKAKRHLPSLKHEMGRTGTPEQNFDTLLVANAFDVGSKMPSSDDRVLQKFSTNCADIVVGNPPWGSPGARVNDRESREAMDVALDWCQRQEPQLHVGDREWSQAFIHRVIDILRDGGQAGLLVSAGVLFKSHEKSRAFRKQWLTSTVLHRVVNFSHVRNVFFKGKARQAGAQSPFISVVFRKQLPNQDGLLFEYWSAKKTAMVNQTQAVLLSRADLHRLRQDEVRENDDLWKIYWWGSHRDEGLIRSLQMETPLEELTVRGTKLAKDDFGQGFIVAKAGKKEESERLQAYKELPKKFFQRYGAIRRTNLAPVPERFYRKGNFRLYEGLRLLIKRGITERGYAKGRIVARLEGEKFCFRTYLHGVRLPDTAESEGKILLGIFWSSLARYYYWLTAGSWMWHNEIHLQDVKRLPVHLPEDRTLRDHIVSIVEKLRAAPSPEDLLYGESRLGHIEKLERDLDEAIFDLYGLSPAERGQVMDMCEHGLDLFYRDIQSDALKRLDSSRPAECCGQLNDVPSKRDAQKGLEGYLRAFLEVWNRELEPDGEFRWGVIRPGPEVPMLAVVFATQQKGEPVAHPKTSNINAWKDILSRLDESFVVPFASKRIYVDGVVRAVSDTDIVVIKRDERRLWTSSMAREDAEATLLQAVHLQEARDRG